MTHIYWIKFRDEKGPMKFTFVNIQNMLEDLEKWQMKSGWIEWMQRD